jgi:hypothetical protein
VNERDFPCRVLLERFSLRSEGDVLGLAAAIDSVGGAGVVIIDTLARASAGSDENAAKDMGELLAALERLQSLTGGLVVVVHHAGKNTFAGLPRAFVARAPASMPSSRRRKGEGGREWISEKVKEDEDGKAHRFPPAAGGGRPGRGRRPGHILRDRRRPDGSEFGPAEAGHADRRESERSCSTPSRRSSGRPLSAAGLGAAANRPCLALEAAIDGAKGHLPVESKRQRERAQQSNPRLGRPRRAVLQRGVAMAEMTSRRVSRTFPKLLPKVPKPFPEFPPRL